MNVLLLSDFGTKQARRHPELKGLPMIGRGKFSAVYDNGDTVLHLTCDPVGYAMHCDGVMAIADQSKHFSQVTNDYGQIGDQAYGDLNLYLYETEKLVKLRGNIQARRQAKQVMTQVSDIYDGMRMADLRAGLFNPASVMRQLANNPAHIESLREAFSILEGFAPNYENALLDMHAANFMVRPADGSLIINDPFVDMRIWNEATTRLRDREQAA